MIEETFYVDTLSGRLKVLLRKPGNSGVFSAVVFVSGFGCDLHETKNSNDEVSAILVKAGFLTVQFNFSVVGTDRELSLHDRAKELNSVLDWLNQRKDIDLMGVGIQATSFGVLTTLVADLRKIKSLVFVSGVYDRAKTFKQEFIGRGATIHLEADTALPRSSGKKTIVGPEFWPSLERFEPFLSAQALNKPVLIIHGDKDNKIKTQFVKKFYAAISGKKKLKIFIGGDHAIINVSRKMREEFLEGVVAWFKKTL